MSDGVLFGHAPPKASCEPDEHGSKPCQSRHVAIPSKGVRLDVLPVELCMMIIELLDDQCFTWFILRHVSRFIRTVAEDVIASELLQHTTITFNGSHLKRNLQVDFYLLTELLALPTFARFTCCMDVAVPFLYTTSRWICSIPNVPRESYMIDNGTLPKDIPSNIILRFKPVLYSPGDTKDMMVLKVDDSEAICLTRFFFSQPKEQREVLSRQAHLVKLRHDLRCVKLPSVDTDPDKEELSLDWRGLCQLYYMEELRIRRASKPWLHWLDTEGCITRLDEFPIPAAVEVLDAWPRDLWIFRNLRKMLFEPATPPEYAILNQKEIDE